MRIVEGACNWAQQPDDAKGFVTLACLEHVVERFAGDHLSDQVWRLALISQLVEARDRLVLERHVGAKLEQEPPRKADISRDVCTDGPHRDASLKTRMFSLINRSEAVGLELTQHAVAAHVVMPVARTLWPRAVPVRGFFSHET